MRRELERREKAGREAGVGNSVVVIGMTRLAMRGRPLVATANQGKSLDMLVASSSIAHANSYQFVAPCAVM